MILEQLGLISATIGALMMGIDALEDGVVESLDRNARRIGTFGFIFAVVSVIFSPKRKSRLEFSRYHPLEGFRNVPILRRLTKLGRDYRSKARALRILGKTDITDHPLALLMAGVILGIWSLAVVLVLEDAVVHISALDYARDLQRNIFVFLPDWGLQRQSWGWLIPVIGYSGMFIVIIFQKRISRLNEKLETKGKIVSSGLKGLIWVVVFVVMIPSAILVMINMPLLFSFAVWILYPIAALAFVPIILLAVSAKLSNWLAQATPIKSPFQVAGLMLVVTGFVVQLVGTMVDSA